jgi:ABC-type transporter Mla subunit MlaD
MTKFDRKKYHRQHRAKNWLVFAILVALVVLFFALTLVKMGANN